MYSTRDLLDWISQPVDPDSHLPSAHDWYLTQLPRIIHLKNLPPNSVLLDVGAGEGSLILFRDWLAFPRPDLIFMGVSLEEGVHTSKYDEFQICDLDTCKPSFSRRPNAIMACQLIEHVGSPLALLEWFHDLLPAGGTVFLDWPSPHTVDLPSRSEFAKAGYDVTTINFFDDHTHKRTYSTDELCTLAKGVGFDVINQGMVDMPFLADRLRDEGRTQGDMYLVSMALWLKTNFVSYCTLRKSA